MLPPARRRGYWRSLVCLAAIALGGGGRDVASEKSRRCHLQQPPGPPPTSTAVFCVYQKPRTLVWGINAKDKAEPVRVEKTFTSRHRHVSRHRHQGTVPACWETPSSRAPKFSHPRRVGSSYLLSGLVKCKTPLTGRFAQSGKYAYYICQSNINFGRDACETPTLNARRFEELVVAKIRSDILTEGNISELFVGNQQK